MAIVIGPVALIPPVRRPIAVRASSLTLQSF
jgi:hypothetical protein